MAISQSSALTCLISPTGIEDFFASYWPDRIFIGHGTLDRLPKPLRSPKLSSVETLGRGYSGSIRFTQGRRCPKMVQIQGVRPALLYEMGLTLQFEDVSKEIEGADAFLRELEYELGIPYGTAFMSVFASPEHEGLSCHYDAQDLISIQLRGTKQFHIAPVEQIRNPYGVQYVPGTEPFDELYPQATQGFPDAEGVEFQTVEMRPGTVLILPRGTWHYTEAENESVSVSIILDPPIAADSILQQLRWLLLQDPRWRRPLYGAQGNPALQPDARATMDELLAELPEVAGSLCSAHVLNALLPESQRLRNIAPNSRFQAVPNARIEKEGQGDRAELEVVSIRVSGNSGRERVTVRMQVFREAVDALTWMSQRKSPFTVQELRRRYPGFADGALEQLVAGAAQGGLLKSLWFEKKKMPKPKRQ